MSQRKPGFAKHAVRATIPPPILEPYRSHFESRYVFADWFHNDATRPVHIIWFWESSTAQELIDAKFVQFMNHTVEFARVEYNEKILKRDNMFQKNASFPPIDANKLIIKPSPSNIIELEPGREKIMTFQLQNRGASNLQFNRCVVAINQSINQSINHRVSVAVAGVQ
jgi:hypothetical protein